MLTLHYDLTSPAAAVAVCRLERLAAEGAQVRFAPLDVLGLSVAVPVPRRLRAEVERWRPAAAAEGLELTVPGRQPPTLDAHLLGVLAEQAGCGRRWRNQALRAFWTEGVALEDPATLVALAERTGLDPGEATDLLDDAAARHALRGRMAAQRRRGIGGVPVLEVDGSLVPGDLSLDEFRALAR